MAFKLMKKNSSEHLWRTDPPTDRPTDKVRLKITLPPEALLQFIFMFHYALNGDHWSLIRKWFKTKSYWLVRQYGVIRFIIISYVSYHWIEQFERITWIFVLDHFPIRCLRYVWSRMGKIVWNKAIRKLLVESRSPRLEIMESRFFYAWSRKRK